ncbi:MAG: dockerin type I domain-containing protein, partial [Clostridium sp.]
MRKQRNKNSKLCVIVLILFLITLIPGKIPFAAAVAVPGTPSIAHNQWAGDLDGNYNITFNMWYGNNGTSYKLYEKIGQLSEYKVVSEGKLSDNSPSAQSQTIEIAGRTIPATYFYYVELINSYGSSKSNVIEVSVGTANESKILIEGIDGKTQSLQAIIGQGKNQYKVVNYNTATPNYSVKVSNSSVLKATIESNGSLTLEGLASGRSGLQIYEASTNETRYIGVKVKEANGDLPGMPNYLSLGQVSEDKKGDLDFWKDIDTDDTNKRMDVRYIYINGGPLKNGWREWTTIDGDRAKNYIKESLKLGIIPFFVYYNIPDSGESYDLDLAHINSKEYMEAYFKDLKFLLDICVEYGQGETIGLIFEPDFLGYMMQQSKKQPNEISALVETAYSSGVLEKGVDPTFENNVNGLVTSINYIVNKYYPEAYNGWQFNTWAFENGEIPGQGLMHLTERDGWDSGRAQIQAAAKATADYYLASGITSYNTEFISLDKYGLDGGICEQGAADDPKSSKWFWNADLWNNYLLYTKTLHETTKQPVILWQLPVGHINGSVANSPYTGKPFETLTNKDTTGEDSAPTFFFGDTFKIDSDARLKYFSTNVAKNPNVSVSGNTVTWKSHMEEAKDAGVVSMLFGAGVNSSTDAVGSPPTEDYWWMTKAQQYYKNPLYLNKPVEPTFDKEDVDKNGVVNKLDLELVSQSYNKNSKDSTWNSKLDLNNDYIIDIYDLVIVSKKIVN